MIGFQSDSELDNWLFLAPSVCLRFSLFASHLSKLWLTLCCCFFFFFFFSNFFGYYLPGSIEPPFPVPSLPVYLYACLWSNVAIWPGFTMLQNVFNYDHMFAISSLLLLLPLPPGSWWFLSYLRGFNDPSVQGGPDRDCAIVLQWELCLRQSSSEWRGTDKFND